MILKHNSKGTQLVCTRLLDKYLDDFSEHIQERMKYLKIIHTYNFGEDIGLYKILSIIKMYKSLIKFF